MQTRKVHYTSREEMFRGVNRMMSDGWMVQVVTSLQSNAYKVEFVKDQGFEVQDIVTKPNSAFVHGHG